MTAVEGERVKQSKALIGCSPQNGDELQRSMVVFFLGFFLSQRHTACGVFQGCRRPFVYLCHRSGRLLTFEVTFNLRAEETEDGSSLFCPRAETIPSAACFGGKVHEERRNHGFSWRLSFTSP